MSSTKDTGYSGTPLAKKLGIREGYRVLVLNPPKDYLDFFTEFPAKVIFVHGNEVSRNIDFIHLFCTTHEELRDSFAKAKRNLTKNGILWVSWPKKTSKIPTELDKSQIRQFGLKGGLVDTKVAAIDPDWSGHKFVFRIKDR
ncbi:MAG: DUF3052 family protein [Bacteroidota bacterium]